MTEKKDFCQEVSTQTDQQAAARLDANTNKVDLTSSTWAGINRAMSISAASRDEKALVSPAATHSLIRADCFPPTAVITAR